MDARPLPGSNSLLQTTDRCDENSGGREGEGGQTRAVAQVVIACYTCAWAT